MMAKLIWHQEGKNRVEYGLDRGVFYSPIDSGRYDYGVVWNGLISVDEVSIGGANTSYYYDGIKYLDVVEPRNYQATLSSYYVPQQFNQTLGEIPVVPGFILTKQKRTLFGLSYRTFVGPDLGYKIHLVYHVMASARDEAYSTVDSSGEPDVRSWVLDAVPPIGVKHKPTAHYILDSLKMNSDALDAIEHIIYGTDKTTARLPTIDELRDLVVLWNPLIIVPQSATGLAGLVSGMGDLYTTSVEGINRAVPQTRLVSSPVNGLYRLE